MIGGDDRHAPLAEIMDATRMPLDDVADARILAVLSYWRDRRRDAGMPRRADIEPTALRAHLDRISLVDVTHDPLRYRFRLVGTGVARVVGHDNTGRWVDEIEPKAQRDILIAHYGAAVRERAPVVHEVCSQSADGAYRYVRVCCPLSEDGNTVNMLLLASFSLDDG